MEILRTLEKKKKKKGGGAGLGGDLLLWLVGLDHARLSGSGHAVMCIDKLSIG